ncbi:hypothetical protein P280DRAFT_471556 [Massarina eburnea CBS 473.64]|uniref:AA1-like domain-containing protein n=1 Tax=Massarina eburnea CBS 473.64 TaxID=1395130 RepID=A0A6A6RUR0_9PLEO|nr:hypothetical protein P280DRAFT_471556 [Massarina eburnea CBS 473.64]
MHFPALNGLFLGTAFVSVSATPLHLRQIKDAVVFTVTNLVAFEADPYVDGAQSNLTFHVADTRPGFEAETNCVVPNTYFNLHAISALYDVCEKREWSYSYGDRGLTVQRRWRANDTAYVTGTASQAWGWKEEGPGANVTKFADGKLYVRKEEWLFPVSEL